MHSIRIDGEAAAAQDVDRLDDIASLLSAVDDQVGVKHLWQEGRLLDGVTTIASLCPSVSALERAFRRDSRFVLAPAPWNSKYSVVTMAQQQQQQQQQPQPQQQRGRKPSVVNEGQSASVAAVYEVQLATYLRTWRSATVGSMGIAHPPPLDLGMTCSQFVRSRVELGVFRSKSYQPTGRREGVPQVVISLGVPSVAHARPKGPNGSTSNAQKLCSRPAPVGNVVHIAALQNAVHDTHTPLTPGNSGRLPRSISDLGLPDSLDDDDGISIIVGNAFGTPAALKGMRRGGDAGNAHVAVAAMQDDAGDRTETATTAAPASSRTSTSQSRKTCRYGSSCFNFPSCPFKHPEGMLAVETGASRERRSPGRTSSHRQQGGSGAPLLVVYNSASPKTPRRAIGDSKEATIIRSARRSSTSVAADDDPVMASPPYRLPAPSTPPGSAPPMPATEHDLWSSTAPQQTPTRAAPRRYAPPLHSKDEQDAALPRPVSLPTSRGPRSPLIPPWDCEGRSRVAPLLQ